MPFDIGRFMEAGGKYAYEILSEQKKYKNKMDEIEAKIKGEKEEEERKRQDNFIESGMGFIENIITSGKFNVETNRAIYQSGLEMGLPLPPLPGMAPVPTEVPTAGTTMPGELPSLRPEDVAGVGALFGPPAEEPKERAYGFTQKEFEAKEKYKAGLKPEPIGKTAEERQLDRDIAIIKDVASFLGGEKKIKRDKPGLWAAYVPAKKRLMKRRALPRYAKDADDYFDRRLHLYGQLDEEVAKQRAKEDTIKFIRMMGIEPEELRPYIRER